MLETERLILRNWQECDAAALYQICRDETLRKSGAAFFESVQDAVAAIRSVDVRNRAVHQKKLYLDYAVKGIREFEPDFDDVELEIPDPE